MALGFPEDRGGGDSDDADRLFLRAGEPAESVEFRFLAPDCPHKWQKKGNINESVCLFFTRYYRFSIFLLV